VSDEVFLGPNYNARIQQGREFLPRNPATTGFEEIAKVQLQIAEAAYREAAAVASLEHNPGFQKVLEHLDEQIASLAAEAENNSMNPDGNPHTTDKKVFAMTTLMALRKWLAEQPARHSENLERLRKAARPEEEGQES